MTEHIQNNKKNFIEQFLHSDYPSSITAVWQCVYVCVVLCSLLSIFVCVCVCVLHLTDIVTNVTSQNHYSKSPICYTLRDLCIYTNTHTHTHKISLAAWCLCRSFHRPSGEQQRKGIMSLFSLCLVSTHILIHSYCCVLKPSALGMHSIYQANDGNFYYCPIMRLLSIKRANNTGTNCAYRLICTEPVVTSVGFVYSFRGRQHSNSLHCFQEVE